MPVLPRLTSFIRTLSHGSRLDAELDDELRAYVDLLTEEKIAAGLTPEAARRAALVEVGGVEQVKERVRDVRVGVWLDTVWQDVRYAVRGFRRSPWFTATAVASLAIGIGFNAAIFSALDAVLLQPLPYKDPERIVEITGGDFSNEVSGVSPGQFDEWEHGATLFERMGVADWYHATAALRDGPTLTLISVLRASSGFLSVFGVQPVRGRLLRPQDDVPGSNVAVITYDAWLRYWRGDTSVLGRSVKIDGTAYTIVGIMPAGFSLYHPVNQYHPPTTDDRTVYDIFLSDPWALMPRTNRTGWTLWGIGRLKPGVTRAQATAELSALQSAISRGEDKKATALPFAWIGRETSTSLWIAWGAVAALLLLAATNIANLLLARASARRQEIGIRAAIGASRRRLVRQLLTESLLLALWGGIAGLLLNVWLMPLLPLIIPGAEQLPRLAEARTSWTVLGFTLLVSVVIGVGFGIAPALGGSNRGSMAILIGRRSGGRPAAVRGRRALLVSQAALSLVLLAGAGLMLATAARLLAEPLGFDPSGLLTFSVEAPRAPAYVTDLGLREVNEQMRARFWAATPRLHALPKRLTDSLRRVPGVISVAVADGVPMYQGFGVSLGLPDQPPPTKEQRKDDGAWWAHVTPGYFDTLGIHLVYGRDFSPADDQGSPPVAIVSRAIARAHWPTEAQAIGRRIRIDYAEPEPREIVGIVEDVRFWVRDRMPQVYTPYAQGLRTFRDLMDVWARNHYVAVRVDPHLTSLGGDLHRAVTEATGLPVGHLRSMQVNILAASGTTPAITVVLTLAATIALLLAAIGIFGVASYTVSQRTQEIGIRMALGASRGAVLRLVLAGGVRLAVAGVVIGLVGAYWASKLIEGQLYQTSPTDPRVFAAVVVVLVGVVLFATWLPARRAAAVDPVVALRTE